MRIDIDYARSEGDDKNYRIIQLQPSGLECLLISTKTRVQTRCEDNSKAAAAMSVQVGSFADPTVAEGCAHFLEHMVFMGSDKYPVENHYDAFVTAHGGGCNAFTEGEYTAYQFDVNAEHFDTSLDIFANCFISPLLLKSAAEREINAIESEFNLAKTEDGSRLQQLFAHQANDGHVLRKFSWGNYNSLKTVPASLGVDVHEVLRSFHTTHYVPSNMKLVVMAPQGLEELEAVVHTCFGNWVNPLASVSVSEEDSPRKGRSDEVVKKQRTHSDAAMPASVSKVHLSSLNLEAEANAHYEGEPPCVSIRSLDSCIAASRSMSLMQETALASLTRVVPLRQTHKLILLWQLPSYCTQYRSKPCAYIGHLLGHEGSGSVLSYLKHCNFASSLSAGVSDSNSDDNSMFTLFEVSVVLTELGLANWPAVAQAVHQYIRMMRENKPQKRIFDELQQVCATYFRYKDEEEPSDYVERLSVEMLPLLGRHPRSDILGASHLLWEYSPDAIQQVVSQFLAVRRAKVTLTSSAFLRGDAAAAVEVEGDDDDSASESDSGSESGSSEEGSEIAEEDSGDGGSDDVSKSDGDAQEGKNAFPEGKDATSPTNWTEKLRGLYNLGTQDWLPLILPPAADRVPSAEPHFGTQYWDDRLPDDLYAFWEVACPAELFLPPPNSYIPTDFALIADGGADSGSDQEAISMRAPVRVSVGDEGADNVVLWHLPDTTFKTPKAELFVRLSSSVPLQSARSAALLDLFSRLMKDVLNEELYMASMADLDCGIETVDAGLLVKICGFSDKACLLAASVLRAINGFSSEGFRTVQDDTMVRVKETQLRQYRNSNLKASHCASNSRLRALKPSKYSADEKAAELTAASAGVTQRTAGTIADGITTADLRAFAKEFTGSAVCESFIQGNVSSERAVAMVRDVALTWNSLGTLAVMPKQPISCIPTNTAVVLRAVPQNPSESNCCVEAYFQLGAWNIVDSTRLDLLEQLLGEPFFDDLRTKQQLGYSVSCGTRNTYGTLGFCFQVQSSKFTVEAVTSAVLNFISEMHEKVIEGCTPESYLDQVEALRGNKLTLPQSLSEAARAHWGEIEDGMYCFHAGRQQAALLKDDARFSQSAIATFCKEIFLDKPRLLVVQATRAEQQSARKLKLPVQFVVHSVQTVSIPTDVHALCPC